MKTTGRTAVRVAVPVKLARLRVWVDKGRHWSGADRLILWALTVQPRTTADLHRDACIPARLVNEIILRLMRFGWIELAATSRGAAFRATGAGQEMVETFDTLPPVTKRTARRVSFVLEPFEWKAFGLRDLKPYRLNEIENIAREHDVRRIDVEGDWRQMGVEDLFAAADQMLQDDEELSSIDFNASNSLEQFALFTVIDDAVKGLPPDPPAELVDAVRRAGGEKNPGAKVQVFAKGRRARRRDSGARTVSIPTFNPEDVVLSGLDHRDLLVETLRRASSHVVMHSTFLREAAFVEMQDEFRRTAKRGVRIDIFWGAAADERGRTENLEAAIAIIHRIAADHHLRDRAKVHLYSTGSHAKLIVADRGGGPEGEHVAVVGSCNWLSTGFHRTEASVVIRHPHAVALVAQQFADLVFGSATSSQVSADLTALARALRKQPAVDGPARVRIVAGDDHGEMVRTAREQAERSILVGGDRFGMAAEARTIVPLIKAAGRAVDTVICFSRPSGPVKRQDQRELTVQSAAAGVRLVQIPKRELHGKLLLWDDDHVVVTSLNWSSADTRRDAPQAEIGVYIQSPGLAADVRRRMLDDWPSLGPELSEPAPAKAESPTGRGTPRRRRSTAPPGTAR